MNRRKVDITKIHTYTGHQDAVYTIIQGSEDNTFYSGAGDGNIIEWDLNNFKSGRLIAKVPASVYALCFIKELDILIVGQNYEGLHLIKTSDKSEAGSLKLTSRAIFDIQVHKGLILVAAGQGEFFIIDLKSLTVLKKSTISEQNLRSIVILPNDQCLVGASDGQIISIDLSTHLIKDQIIAHEKSVFGLAYHHQSSTVVSGSRDAILKFWDTSGDELTLLESINAHMYAINDIAFKSDQLFFASASMDKTIKVWDYDKRQLLKVIDKSRHGGHLTSVNKLVWSPHKDYLISCSDDRSISVWDIRIEK